MEAFCRGVGLSLIHISNAYNTDKWKDGEIPAHYAVQCYHYMAVTGRKSWYIAVVLLGVGFQYTKLTWDDEIIQNLIQLEKRFWQEQVEKRIMPEPDGSTACDAVLEQYFHTARRNSTVPLIGFDGKLERRQELDGLIQKLELEKRQIDQEVKLAMVENETAVSARFRVSWTNVNTSRLDAKRMKMELPEVYLSLIHIYFRTAFDYGLQCLCVLWFMYEPCCVPRMCGEL